MYTYWPSVSLSYSQLAQSLLEVLYTIKQILIIICDTYIKRIVRDLELRGRFGVDPIPQQSKSYNSSPLEA